MDYSRIINLIKESDFVEFADYGDGIADEWIYKAEARLGLKLPGSYKWWLKYYSGGEISGEEIYSIYEMDFDSVRGGDIVYMSIVNGRNGLCGKERLFICEPPGAGESFYFATDDGLNDGEYPVYRLDLSSQTSSLYAKNFIDFLEKRIVSFS